MFGLNTNKLIHILYKSAGIYVIYITSSTIIFPNRVRFVSCSIQNLRERCIKVLTKAVLSVWLGWTMVILTELYCFRIVYIFGLDVYGKIICISFHACLDALPMHAFIRPVRQWLTISIVQVSLESNFFSGFLEHFRCSSAYSEMHNSYVFV